MIRAIRLAAPLVVVLATMKMAFGDATTNVFREIAKNKPSVSIVVSGPDANDAANALESALLHRSDNCHSPGDYKILTVDQAQQAASSDPSFGKSPLIFLLIGGELSTELPSSLAAYLPQPIHSVRQKSSIIAVSLVGSDKHLVFSIELFAPDTDRLSRLSDLLATRSAATFRDLPFNQTYVTNKLAVFSSPENQSFAQNWGVVNSDTVWNDVVWHDLADRSTLSSDQLNERSQIYFQSRGDNDRIPSDAQQLLPSTPIRATTVIIAHGPLTSVNNDDAEIAVVSAPNRQILGTRAAMYANVDSLNQAPDSFELADMRAVRDTTMLLTGDVPDNDRRGIRYVISDDLSKTLGIDIDDLPSELDDQQGDISLDQLQGASAESQMLRRKIDQRYVWHVEMLECSGDTTYEAVQSKLTPDPPAFALVEPTVPSRSKGLFQGNKSDDEYSKEMDQYHDDHDKWQQKKDDYDYKMAHAIFDWERDVKAHATSKVHCIIRLLDLKADGNVIWEHECAGSTRRETIYQSDHVSLQGPRATPTPLQTPAPLASCPRQLVHESALKVAEAAIADLLENALLPPVQ
jgi:hypothetical protein